MFKYFAIFIFCISQCDLVAQVIPNGDFEVWGLYNTWTLEPEFWHTPNNQIVESVQQDTDAYEGEFAMKVHAAQGIEGGMQQVANVFFTVDNTPVQLKFYAKTFIPEADVTDNVSVTVELRHLGVTVYTQTHGMFETINEWQLQVMEIQAPPMLVDEARVHVAAGYNGALSGGSPETWISVDMMEFVSNINVQDLVNREVKVFPNPASGYLTITTSSPDQNNLEAIINSMDGAVQMHEIVRRSLDISKLSPGMYILTLLENGMVVRRQSIAVE
jgi:hypothetical protein